MLNETICWYKKHKMKGMLLKVKFEKAYNSLSVWDLVYALQKTGFGEKW